METITIEINTNEASIIALYLKRIGSTDYRFNSTNEDEASCMKYALASLEQQLNKKGFDHR